MTVNNVNALLTYASNQTEQAGMKAEEASRDSFTQIMNKASSAVGQLKTELAGSANTVARTAEPMTAAKNDTAPQKPESERRVASDSDKAADTPQQDGGSKAVKNTDAGTEADTDPAAEQAAEEVEKAGAELVQEIAREMDVTPEEVEEAMAVLGLVAPQLLDLDNLKQVLLTISGSADEFSLVTDETLYSNMKNLFAEAGESLASLQEELGMSEEELSALVERMVSEDGDAEVTDAAPVQQMPETEPDGSQEPKLPEGMKDYTVTVQRDGKTVQMKVTVDDASGDKSVQEEVSEAPKEVLTVHRTREKETSADADGGRGEGNAAGSAFLQTPDRTAEAVETPEPVNTAYQSPQTEAIMNQIMDYMRINLRANVQEMELQLHPASLGTVNVQIASKDGAITAQFTTQNETVRAVVETQLIQLKNQFEEQGIKVDAVEVTVANHEYGQQFSQENGNAEQKQNKSARSTRRINLDELDGEADVQQMEESERIAVEMMQANGGSVDYMA